MGEIYTATCPCGYTKPDMFLGVGMLMRERERERERERDVIYQCDRCHELLVRKESVEHPRCGHCHGRKVTEIKPIPDSTITLTCPGCQQQLLTLEDTGMWD